MATIATEVITTPSRFSLLAFLRQCWADLCHVPEGPFFEHDIEIRAARAAKITLQERLREH